MTSMGIRDDSPPYESFEIDEEPLHQQGSRDKRFSPLPSTPGFQDRRPKPVKFQEVKVSRWFILALSTITIFIFAVLYFANTGDNVSRDASAAAHTGSSYESGFNMRQNWGSYSPYFDTGVPFDGVSRSALDGDATMPKTCKLKQVHVLHRHGDRFPAEGTTQRMEKIAEKSQNSKGKDLPASLEWSHEWKYLLSEELLVGAGVGSLFESGAKFWGSHGRSLYGNESEGLAFWNDDINVWANNTQRPKPSLRATTQSRIQDSARAWAAGFFGTYGRPSSGGQPEDHYNLVLMSEESRNNNSLAGYLACPNADNPAANRGKDLSREWVDNYLQDAATRISKILPGLENVSADECLAMQDLCVFETAAYGSSAFCSLFTEQEWRGFEYHADLKFYGESAWGSEVGPATGMPWVTELRAFLARRLIKDPINGINTTSDSDSSTFPINQPFTADFTHDSVIISVLSALQFPFTMTDLPANKIKIPRQMIISRSTPFAARLYVEVLSCGTDSNKGDYIRLRLNDRVSPIGDLKFCSDDDKMGLCSFHDFMKHLDWALSKQSFEEKCFAKMKNLPAEESAPSATASS